MCSVQYVHAWQSVRGKDLMFLFSDAGAAYAVLKGVAGIHKILHIFHEFSI